LERQAANLLFALIARRYERGSIIVISNRGFEAVHHATVLTVKGKSHRLRRAQLSIPDSSLDGTPVSVHSITTSGPRRLRAGRRVRVGTAPAQAPYAMACFSCW
jgi:hypothetical protein